MTGDTVLRQRLEELAGARRAGSKGKAAVRLEDLQGLLALPATLKSAKAAGAAVTVAEYDALVEDVHTIHRLLRALVGTIRTRRGR